MGASGSAWDDAKAGYKAVMGNRGAILRYAGLPMLISFLISGLLMGGLEPPAEGQGISWFVANAPVLSVNALVGAWASALMSIRWQRWFLLGEDDRRWALLPLADGPVWRYALGNIAIGLLVAAAVGLAVLAAGMAAVLGGMLFGQAGAAAFSFLGGMMALALMPILVGRCSPGLVPVALGEKAAVRRSFDMTKGISTRLGLGVLLFLGPMLLALAVAGGIAMMLPEVLAGVVQGLVALPFLAGLAVAWAKVWREISGPGALVSGYA
ncbi:MAG TPA: hypothetical protein VED40_01945 [Azospirillaceae bacterium]|nr:hypothetical protein [Azospirillaceae bacterium]